MYEVTLKGHNPQTVVAPNKGAAYKHALRAIRTLLGKSDSYSPLSERIVQVEAEIGQTAVFVSDLA